MSIPDDSMHNLSTCLLCGQRYPVDTGPCGCGKRVIEMVSIPKSKLREWRRGLMALEDFSAQVDGEDEAEGRPPTGLNHHAREIRAEIEGYLK